MAANPQLFRKGLGLKQEVQASFRQLFGDPLVERLRRDQKVTIDGLTLLLPREFGFCYGVERALDFALQSVAKFKGKRLFLLGEIVHNPAVNRQLTAAGIQMIPAQSGGFDLSGIKENDVVLVPAFGIPVSVYDQLEERRCVVVDTTCGSVITVWKRVESYARDGFTTVIHGKFPHEETNAICSRVCRYPNAHYVIVRTPAEAEFLASVIRGESLPSRVLSTFSGRLSPHFDPQIHLSRIGIANQTTMLSSETEKIASILEQALKDRYGEKALATHFRRFSTICRATQDRQDGLRQLLENEKPQLMLVVGGFNSSNTGQLARIASESVPTFHIADVSDLISAGEIRHKETTSGEIRHTSDWLPSSVTRIGFAAGASTPDSRLGAVIRRVLQLKGVTCQFNDTSSHSAES